MTASTSEQNDSTTAPEKSPLKTLGVTGGIGSGKTTVCRFLEAEGAKVFYADIEAKRLMRDDPDARAAIKAAFGPASYTGGGSLNRAYLADQVFNDPDRLERLNAIVHPLVFEAFETAKERAADEGVPLLVHEAALLFEAGGDAHVDATAVVDAPEADRIARVVERDEVAPEQVRARMAHQLPPAELRRRADYVIDNDGTLDDLRTASIALYHAIVDDSD
jgi:dephospho-CoA kinase